jgi:hypothetical protein
MSKVQIFTFLFFLSSANTIFACMCGNSSISEMYKNSDAIVSAKVIGFKPTVVEEDWIIYEDGDEKKGKKVHEKLQGQQVTLEISRWFKGAYRKSILILSQPNSTCDWSFNEQDLKKKFLFYLYFNKKYKTYKIIACGRSSAFEDAADDLSWLSGLPKSLQRTRLSGVVQLKDDKNTFPPVGSIKIKIIGNNKNYELITDINGLYEIWDLPPGKYTINSEMPETKKIAWTSSVPDGFTAFWSADKPENSDSLKVTLKPKSTAGIDFMLEKN